MTGDFLALFRSLEQLKHTRRTGWIDRGIPPEQVESVADHTLMTALIAWFLAREDETLEADRVLKLAIIHDLAEALVGDRPPYEPHEVPSAHDPEAVRAFFSVRHLRTPENRAAKRQDEERAAAHLISLMPEGVREEIRSLWSEYEEQGSPEARFVKEVDRLEAFLQSRSYLREHPDVPVWGFADMAQKEIDHPVLSAIRDAALDIEDAPR
jgi:putative hydrolase of HD superfamily